MWQHRGGKAFREPGLASRCEFGITEALAGILGGASLFGGLFGGAEAGLGLGAAELGGLGAAEAGAGALSSGAALGGALDATAALGIEGGASALGGIGGFGAELGADALAAAAPTAITVNALPGAAALGGDLLGAGALGAGAAGIGGLLGDAASSVGNALVPSAGAGELPAGAQPGLPAGQPSATPGTFAQRFDASFPSLNQGGGAPGGAQAFAAPQSVQGNPDLTSSFGSRFGAATDAITSGDLDPQGANFNPTAFAASSTTQPPAPFTGAPTSPPVGPSAVQPPAGPVTTPSLDTLATNTAAANATPVGAGAPTSLAPPAQNPATSGGGFLNSLTNAASKNPIGLALGAGGLAYNLSQGQKQSSAVKALQSTAQPLAQQGAQLSSYISSGTLPPGFQGQVDQATAAAKANAIANAAANGQPTDPHKNTALAATLAGIDRQVPIITAQIAQQLLTSGVQESGLAANIYGQLANIDQQQTQSIGKAIASMAAALNTGTRIQIGGTAA